MSSIKLKHSGGNSVSLNPPTSAPTSSDVAFKLPNADGSANQVLKTDGSGNFSFVDQPSGGLEMADQWRTVSDYTQAGQDTDVGSSGNSAAPSPAALERADGSSIGNYIGQLGSGMTQTGGVFTFPSTGHYLIKATGKFYANQGAASLHSQMRIFVTVDGGSNYNAACVGTTNMQVNALSDAHAETLFDVTDVSTHKVKFNVTSDTIISVRGNTNKNETYFTFLKLGDT